MLTQTWGVENTESDETSLAFSNGPKCRPGNVSRRREIRGKQMKAPLMRQAIESAVPNAISNSVTRRRARVPCARGKVRVCNFDGR
jgi:hypothetical protein